MARTKAKVAYDCDMRLQLILAIPVFILTLKVLCACLNYLGLGLEVVLVASLKTNDVFAEQ